MIAACMRNVAMKRLEARYPRVLLFSGCPLLQVIFEGGHYSGVGTINLISTCTTSTSLTGITMERVLQVDVPSIVQGHHVYKEIWT